jgi:uncharacterized surface protein with fasciclin (FAS1) repeats
VLQIRRQAVLGAAALTFALTACGSVTPGSTQMVAPAAQASQLTYGAACDGVPTDQLARKSAAAAIAESPALSTLAGVLEDLPELRKTLAEEPTLTVLAPSDAAFDELRATLGNGPYQALLADRAKLDGWLSYHVTLKRYDAGQLVDAGKTTQLAYGDVTVSGTADALQFASASGDTAGVSCGNVRTANATIFVVDHVLRPAAPRPTR